MRHHTGTLGVLVLPLMVAGCAHMNTTTKSSNPQTNMTAVSVRFMMPTDWAPAEDAQGNPDAALASVNPSGGSAVSDGFEQPTGAEGVPHHVALWGGAFDGTDMTHGVASLTPGSYTFAYVDRENDAFMQGWLEVNGRGFDLLDILYRWRESVPRQKHQLAFEMDLRGEPTAADEEMFNQFAEQLQAFDRLEQRIDQTIQSELRARTLRTDGWNHFLNGAEVLIMPGGEPVFQATTRPAISRAELASLSEGESLTKIILVADYDEAQWKMRRVDALHSELNRCYTLFGEVAERLERRKGLFLMTDHLFNNDKKFVRNERWLQQTIGAMEQLDLQMNDLRDRRVALAFISELIAPGTQAGALVRAQERLFRERTQFQTEKRRVDTIFAETKPESRARISLERSRQRLKESLASIDRQLDDLTEAREAVATMTASTQILHRQGDKRMLAATFVGEALPFKLRTAVQRESLMTVRVQASANVFVPTVRGMRAGGTISYQVGEPLCCRTVTEIVPAEEVQMLAVAEPVNSNDNATNVVVVAGQPETSPMVTEQITFDEDGNPCVDPFDETAGYDEVTAGQGELMEPTKSAQATFAPGVSNRPATVVTTTPRAEVQAAQSQDGGQVMTGNSAGTESPAVNYNVEAPSAKTTTVPASYRPKSFVEDGGQNSTNDDCPLFLKFLVPPCWLHGLINADKTADNTAGTQSQVAKYEPRTSFSTPTVIPAADRPKSFVEDGGQNSTNDDCPLFLKFLVPPCWLHGLINADKTADNTAGTRSQLAGYKDEAPSSGTNAIPATDRSQNTTKNDCPLLLKLLVPPCWLHGLINGQDTNGATANNNGGANG